MTSLNLRQRILLLSVLPALLVALITITFFTYVGIQTLEKELRTQGQSTVRFLAPVSEYSLITGQIESLQTLVQTTVQEHRVKAAMILSNKGRPLAVSGRVSVANETFRQLGPRVGEIAETAEWIAFSAPIFRVLNEPDSLFETDDIFRSDEKEPIGYVLVEMDKTEVIAKQQELLHVALLLVGMSLLIIGGLSMRIADRLGVPLVRLVSAVRALGEGRFDTRIDPVSHGEMGVLESGFNEMASHIEEVRDTMRLQIEAATAQLSFQASHDPLTGLLNRREFDKQLDQTLQHIRSGSDESSLLYIDLDRFKPVNDSCGHQAGDELLCRVSQLLQGRLRENDVLARLGGDEFSVILIKSTGAPALQVAEDLRTMLSNFRFIWQDKVFSISASIGLCTLTAGIRSGRDAIAAADAGCYLAKDAGRNSVCVHEVTDTGDRRSTTETLSDRVQLAIADGRVRTFAQPLLSLTAPESAALLLSAQIRDVSIGHLLSSDELSASDRDWLQLQIQKHLVEDVVHQFRHANRVALKIFIPVSHAFLAFQIHSDFFSALAGDQEQLLQNVYFLIPSDIPSEDHPLLQAFIASFGHSGAQVAMDFDTAVSLNGELGLPDGISAIRFTDADFLNLAQGETSIHQLITEFKTNGMPLIAVDSRLNPQIQAYVDLGFTYLETPKAGACEPLDVWLAGTAQRRY